MTSVQRPDSASRSWAARAGDLLRPHTSIHCANRLQLDIHAAASRLGVGPGVMFTGLVWAHFVFPSRRKGSTTRRENDQRRRRRSSPSLSSRPSLRWRIIVVRADKERRAPDEALAEPQQRATRRSAVWLEGDLATSSGVFTSPNTCCVVTTSSYLPSFAMGPIHPLDPLTREEISAAVPAAKANLLAQGVAQADLRFESVELQEPSEEVKRAIIRGDQAERGDARCVVPSTGRGSPCERLIAVAVRSPARAGGPVLQRCGARRRVAMPGDPPGHSCCAGGTRQPSSGHSRLPFRQEPTSPPPDWFELGRMGR
eukprot:scaffold3651_cov230-Prasinococcus_capsulatus_cf.AAC.7